MKTIISTLLLLTLFLGACSSADSSSVTAESNTPVESNASESSQQVETSREAILSEIENEVTVESSPALLGMSISVGQTVQTGEDSRAKLNLMPEGTIVRVGPNSSFTLSQMEKQNGEPRTNIELLFGKVFVLLNGGSLEVETPSGVASVRGSLLSVQYDPNTNRVRASCLEGECSLENENGEEVELTEGESVFVDEDGNLSDITEIDQDEIEDWLDENPELDEFMDELPDPEEYPDFEDDEWYTEDEFSSEEEATEEGEEVTDDATEESSSDD